VKLYSLLLSLVFLQSALTLQAAQFTVDWPTDVQGNYNLPSLLPKPSTVSGTYNIDDGKAVRLVGRGFDLTFVSKQGKLTFPQRGILNGATGVRFDPASNTFSFVTVEVKTVVKNCDVPINIDGIRPAAAAKTPAPDVVAQTSYKIVYGTHFLNAPLPRAFNVDAHGVVTFQEQVPGIVAQGSTISVEGRPFQVVTTSTSWQIQRSTTAKNSGNATVNLVPGAYAFQGGGTVVPFVINNDGLLSTQPGGPFVEFLNLADSADATQAAAKIMIPGGEAKYAARLAQEKVDQTLFDQVMAGSNSATWKDDIALTDVMKVYDFPEEQLSYSVEIPSEVKRESLKLLDFADHKVRLIPFQLSTDEKGATTLFFRSDLPKAGTRLFRLVSGFDPQGVSSSDSPSPTLQVTSTPQQAVLANDLLLIKVPAGHQDFAGGKPLSQVPAPILALARTSPSPVWAVDGSFSAPDTLLVDSLDAKVLESGPIFTRYQVAYKLEGGRTYTAVLELRAHESHVRIAESTEGFTPDDQAFVRLDYGKGLLDPDRRLAPSGGGYDLFGGDYDRDAKEGKLNYSIGLFAPNGLGVMRSTAFYNQRPEATDALVLSIDHARDWKTFKRALWSSATAFENIRFFSQGDQKYLTAGLAGSERFWVVGLIPRDQCGLQTLPGIQALATGPENRLYNQLNTWSLNAYKNRLPDWPEKLDAAPFNAPGFIDFQYQVPFVPMSYDEYKKKYLESSYFRDFLSYSSNMGGYSDRVVPAFFAEYALSRATWTPEQRDQVRQILLLLADYCEGDDNQPSHSMLSGHPNFAMDTKQALPFAVETFPNHPRAKAWRDSYMDFYTEWLDRYERKDVAALNTRGGRWTENIACYVGQVLVGLDVSQKCLRAYDGTSLTSDPQLAALLGWMRDSFMSPQDGVRLIPPEGAHSFNFEPGRIGRKVLFDFCAEIAEEQPQLSQEMRWMETNGREGTKPDIHSGLYTDYGPVFHYDFGGPHESYAHLQNLDGLNYRWGGAGVVYYGARNQVWSYNTAETNGDEFDWNQISAFNVKNKGLSPGPTDQLLYDFDFAQFYRQPGLEGGAYVARGVMLVRDDYLVLSDEVRDDSVAGTFNWATLFAPPQIYQLKPGAPVEEKVTRDPQPVHAGNPDRTGKVFSYSGQGDFLTVVAPAVVTATATPFGATVNGEYVFAAQKPETITPGPATFSGSYGYARGQQLALFQGTRIGLNGFELDRDGGDFGVSASVEGDKIIGRLVGRSGGNIRVTPPVGLDANRATVTINGQPVAATVQQGALVFAAALNQSDGLKYYEIHFTKL
jgi:hypothetical protein